MKNKIIKMVEEQRRNEKLCGRTVVVISGYGILDDGSYFGWTTYEIP